MVASCIVFFLKANTLPEHERSLQENMVSNSISFKPIKESDLPQLYTWVHTEHVKKWWYPDALSWPEFHAKYLKKIHSNSVWGYLIQVDDTPIGFIQYYDASKNPDDFGNVDPEGTFGMDLYIGDTNFIGKGYGTRVLSKFIASIKEKHNVTKFIIDPHAENSAAIRTYEKVGFKKVRTEDQPHYGKVIIMEMQVR